MRLVPAVLIVFLAAPAFAQEWVTYYGYANSDRIEGRRVQLTNPDKSKTFAAIYMHENRVYITEATVPGNAPPPALFYQSMGFLDKDGVRVRYDSIYSNAYPAPP